MTDKKEQGSASLSDMSNHILYRVNYSGSFYAALTPSECVSLPETLKAIREGLDKNKELTSAILICDSEFELEHEHLEDIDKCSALFFSSGSGLSMEQFLLLKQKTEITEKLKSLQTAIAPLEVELRRIELDIIDKF